MHLSSHFLVFAIVIHRHACCNRMNCKRNQKLHHKEHTELIVGRAYRLTKNKQNYIKQNADCIELTKLNDRVVTLIFILMK